MYVHIILLLILSLCTECTYAGFGITESRYFLCVFTLVLYSRIVSSILYVQFTVATYRGTYTQAGQILMEHTANFNNCIVEKNSWHKISQFCARTNISRYLFWDLRAGIMCLYRDINKFAG